jgi:protein TonB
MTGKGIIVFGCWATIACLLRAQAPSLCVEPGTQQGRLIYNVRPIYPELAKQAHIQGTVRLAARIDDTGTVESLRLVSGHPLLVKAAFDAVKQWRYRPAMVDGRPVSVVTMIEVTFRMGTGQLPPPDNHEAGGTWVG